MKTPENQPSGVGTIVGQSGISSGESKEADDIHGNHADIEFVGVQRKVVKRIFIGSVKEGVTIEKITQYMKDRRIQPTFVRLMWSKRKGTTSVRKNIFAEDFDTVKESMFWQDHGYHWLNGNIYRGINGATVVTMGDFNAHLQTFRSNQS